MLLILIMIDFDFSRLIKLW